MASPPTNTKPETGGEVMGKHSLDLPGRLGTARVERTAVEPGTSLLPYRFCYGTARAGKRTIANRYNAMFSDRAQ